ncbi:FRG domain-containing protein [Legionella impletisoli]|uniref:FRG domain-containing protein n=1 Tax=Legionella impletisoli TaxID=343510 RepID=A0A917NDQ8_9GAMM|nr:FRG domain-containing protein [Legionella impletisoli]GGI90620.1 FRG domain-containing protein [Legionella impletisoli]
MDRDTPFIMKKYADINSLPIFTSLNDNNYTYEQIEEGVNIPVSRISLWQDFLELVSNQLVNQKNLIFRGHQDPRWTLIPTLKRTHKFLNEEQTNKIIETFKSALQNIEHNDLKQLNDFTENQLWALGRHYGLPTPLLDWTYNPLIALYFAYEDRANLFPQHALYIMDFERITSDNLIFFNNQPHQNEREKKQEGCYIRLKQHKKIEDIISKDKNAHSYFRKIYIKKNDPRKSLDTLEKQHQISKLNLYPNSIEGAVEYCKTQIPSPYEGGGKFLKIKF